MILKIFRKIDLRKKHVRFLEKSRRNYIVRNHFGSTFRTLSPCLRAAFSVSPCCARMRRMPLAPPVQSKKAKVDDQASGQALQSKGCAPRPPVASGQAQKWHLIEVEDFIPADPRREVVKEIYKFHVMKELRDKHGTAIEMYIPLIKDKDWRVDKFYENAREKGSYIALRQKLSALAYHISLNHAPRRGSAGASCQLRGASWAHREPILV